MNDARDTQAHEEDIEIEEKEEERENIVQPSRPNLASRFFSLSPLSLCFFFFFLRKTTFPTVLFNESIFFFVFVLSSVGSFLFFFFRFPLLPLSPFFSSDSTSMDSLSRVPGLFEWFLSSYFVLNKNTLLAHILVLLFVNKRFRDATEKVFSTPLAGWRNTPPAYREKEATKLVGETCCRDGSISLVGWLRQYLRLRPHSDWCSGASEGE
jgi:hypothetical protein